MVPFSIWRYISIIGIIVKARKNLSKILINLVFTNSLDVIKKSDALDLDGKYQQELLELTNAIAMYPDNIDILWLFS